MPNAFTETMASTHAVIKKNQYFFCLSVLGLLWYQKYWQL